MASTNHRSEVEPGLLVSAQIEMQPRACTFPRIQSCYGRFDSVESGLLMSDQTCVKVDETIFRFCAVCLRMLVCASKTSANIHKLAMPRRDTVFHLHDKTAAIYF